MLPNVQDTRPVTASTASFGSAPSVADELELASAWNATVTSEPADLTAVVSSASFLDVITAALASSPSGITAKPHGSTATALESCPSITGRRAAASTAAYATVDSQGPVLLSWRIHLPFSSSAEDFAACALFEKQQRQCDLHGIGIISHQVIPSPGTN